MASTIQIDRLLETTVRRGASDLHLAVGKPPSLRLNGHIRELQTKPLEAEDTGLALIKIQPGQRQPFAHKHKQAEEIYVVLSGAGTIKLDDEVVEVTPMDAIRMAPDVGRSLEAGPEGLEVIAFGPRHEDDVEMLKEFWEE